MRKFRAAAQALCACLLLSGCVGGYSVKRNLSGGQIVETSIISNPSREKSLGFLPKYERLLEGYIRGGLINQEGQAVQGVSVEVLGEKGERLPGFAPGVTDREGIYKVRFSLPIRWGTIDFCGVLACGPEWRLIGPQAEFCLYFDRRNGVLAFSPKTLRFAVKSLEAKPQPKQPAAPPPPAKKKGGDDFFGGMDFGE